MKRIPTKTLDKAIETALDFYQKNKPEILLKASLGLGIAGLVTSNYATIKSVRKIDAMKEEGASGGEIVLAVLPNYIPAATAEFLSFRSGLGALKTYNAELSAYALALDGVSSAYRIYKDETKRALTSRKLEKLEESVSERQREEASEKGEIISFTNRPKGDIKVYDTFTRMEFWTTVRRLEVARDKMRDEQRQEGGVVTLADWYLALGFDYDSIPEYFTVFEFDLNAPLCANQFDVDWTYSRLNEETGDYSVLLKYDNTPTISPYFV